MIDDALGMLRDATLALTASALLLLAIRPWLRARLGAELAYRAWLAVPLAVVATFLPAAPVAAPIANAMPALPTVVAFASDAGGGRSSAIVLLGAWALGAVAMFAAFAWRQRHYVRALALDAALSVHDGVPLRRAHAANASPATVGAWRPWIALPADFEAQYDATERELVLAHERMHVARRDGLANAALAALRCVFWFDPVVHFAARRFRFDQELACDAAVLRVRPDARRAYASAMFKTQLAVPGLPVGCQWQSSPPLKERILMLKKDRATRTRLGGAVTALFVGLVALSSYASQSNGPSSAAPREPEIAPTYAKLLPVPYPREALDARHQGDVWVKVHVGADGSVLAAEVDPDVAQPDRSLQDAAVASVRQWTFNPARLAGNAVATWIRLPISFRLDKDADSPPSDAGLDTIDVRPESPRP